MKLHAMLCAVLVLGVAGCSYFDKPDVVEEPMPTSAALRASQGQAANNVPGMNVPQAVTGQYADITRRTTKGSVEIYSLDGNGFASDRYTGMGYGYESGVAAVPAPVSASESASAPSALPPMMEPAPYHFSAEEEMERARRASVMQGVEK